MSDRTLVYPTAERLRTRLKGDHGAPAVRLARSYRIEPNGCWRWIGSIAGNGYGHFSMGRIYYQAHLLIYIVEVGPLPVGLEPDHLCRNRWCVNPADIEFVTHAVNAQRGAAARLTQGEAEMIRAEVRSGISQRAVGRARGIDHSTVCRIMSGQLWPEQPASVEVAA